jgi:small subunit ribosomal protein S2
MSETPTTPEAEAAPEEAARPRPQGTLQEMLEAGAHFGHQTRRWDPRMKNFIFGERNGIHIIDLDQTMPRLVEAVEFVREVVAQGGKILMVATKRQAQEPVREEAIRANQFYVNNRWLGGMLTNFRTVKRSIEVFKEQLAIVADEEQTAELSKKDLSRLNRSIAKYEKSLDGLKEMQKLPDVMFVIDVNKEHLAIAEANRLGIPVVAIVDTNCSPLGIDFPIPANDDAIRAIQLYCALIGDACMEGAELYNDRVTSQEPAGGGTATSGGRRVVEIQQPPAQPGAGGGQRREQRGGRRPRQAGGSFSAGGGEEAPTPGRGPKPPAEATEAAPGADAAPTAEAAPTQDAAPAAEAATAAESASPAADTGDKPAES